MVILGPRTKKGASIETQPKSSQRFLAKIKERDHMLFILSKYH